MIEIERNVFLIETCRREVGSASRMNGSIGYLIFFGISKTIKEHNFFVD